LEYERRKDKIMNFKIAVIGCGGISMSSHGPSYQKYAANHNYADLAACCDIDPDRAERFRAQFGFKHCYHDYLEMLDIERPDAVCLNVSVEHLCETGCQVMQRGYPLLLEKPPGLNTAEIDRLIETAESTGVIHQVAFNRRFTPLVSELKHKLTGARIQHIDHHLYRVGRTDSDFSTTAIHGIDTVRFLADSNYQLIDFYYQNFPGGSPAATVTNYFLNGMFSSGTSATLRFCPYTGINVEQTLLHTTDSTYVLKLNMGLDSPGSLQQFEKGRLVLDLNASQFSGSSENYILSGFEAEDSNFFEAVRNRMQPEHDFVSGRQSVEIMQAMHDRSTNYQLH